MHIKESSLAMAASHTQTAETRRQILLLPSDGETPASFDELLERARLETESQKPLLALLRDEPRPGQAPEKSLQEILMMLLRCGQDGEPPPQADAPERPRMRALPVLEVVHSSETERCSFTASGNICLADGSTREFDVGYEMERSEESTRVSVGALRDPLVLDFGAPSGKLGEQSVNFDLDADGTAESMRLPASGAAFLFHDLNGNGKADDGKELFGPTSGNGFEELAKLDGDNNRWIDAGDAAYADLMLWTMGDDGLSTYRSLADAGIGALSTRYEETPFTIKENGEVVGQVRGSSVWLGEESGAGIVRQIDLATAPADAKEAAPMA